MRRAGGYPHGDGSSLPTFAACLPVAESDLSPPETHDMPHRPGESADGEEGELEFRPFILERIFYYVAFPRATRIAVTVFERDETLTGVELFGLYI